MNNSDRHERQLAHARMTDSGELSKERVGFPADYSQRFASWLDAKARSADTVRTYLRALQRFAEWLKVPLHEAIPDDVLMFRNWLSDKYSAATANMTLSAIRTFYKWGILARYTLFNPALVVDSLPVKNRLPKRLPLENGEVLATLDAAQNERDRAMLSLMAHNVLRTIEVHSANYEDLGTVSNRPVLFLRIEKGSASSSDYVYIRDDVLRWAEMHPTKRGALFPSESIRNFGDRLSRASIRRIVKQAMRDAGIDDKRKSAHSLRHSGITNAARRGATPTSIQALARHKSFQTTQGYLHLDERKHDPAEDYINFELDNGE